MIQLIDFVDESLQLLKAHASPGYYNLLSVLESTSLVLTVEGPPNHLAFSRLGHQVSHRASSGRPSVHIEWRSDAVLDLIDGRRSLLDQLRSDELTITGRRPAVLIFYDALMIYLDALVRIPEASALLQRYRHQ